MEFSIIKLNNPTNIPEAELGEKLECLAMHLMYSRALVCGIS